MQTSIEQYFNVRKRAAVEELKGNPSKRMGQVLTKAFPYEPEETSTSGSSSGNEELTLEGNTIGSDISQHVPVAQNEEVPSEANEEPTQDDDGRRTPTFSPTEKEKLRKDLGLGEFSKVVQNSRHLMGLKQSLLKYSKNAERLQKIEQKIQKLSDHELRYFDNIEIEVPQSPVMSPMKPKKLRFVSPSPSPVKNAVYVSPRKLLDEGPSRSPVKSASERYKHLLDTGKEPLVLPYKYAMLKEVFNAVDTIVKILMDRGETVTFSKLKPDVQKMLGRNFYESHLGQIITVYPHSYEFNQQKITSPFGRETKYELVIKPYYGGNEMSSRADCMFSLLERQRAFHGKLLEHTKELHRKFLLTLTPPIELNNDQIKRWHPQFDLDSVPDIPAHSLPKPPEIDKVTSVKSFLEKAQDMLQCNKRMEQAVHSLESEKLSRPSTPPPTPKTETTSPVQALQTALKGLPKSLLEKIRAKQAAKAAEAMMQSKAEIKETVMTSRLPELARIMRNVFVTEKKTVLPQEVVLLKISNSFRESLSTDELLQHLQLIAKHVPGWMNFYNARNTTYIRLSKDADLSRVTGKLQKMVLKS